MKKSFITAALVAVMALSMTACGVEDDVTQSNTQENLQEQEFDNNTSIENSDASEQDVIKDTEEFDSNTSEENADAPEQDLVDETEEIELTGWKGLPTYVKGMYADGTSLGISYGVYVSYPNGAVKDAGKFASQWDPCLILVTEGEDEQRFSLKIENIEDTFSISKDTIIRKMDDYRKASYSDFDFLVNSQEIMTINELPCCYYEGVHTYMKDDEHFEIPFVAYSFYTGQIENYSYFTIVVVDDSINRSGSQEPLAEGTIEAYAKKMVESVEIKEYDILYGH